MKTKGILHLISGLIILALALPLWSTGGQAAREQNAPEDKNVQTHGITDIQVSFKLDPRLSGPTYGGEHWVSPPTLTGASAQDTVEAKVVGIGAQGGPVRISPEWIPSDPDMVTVSPSQGDHVKITVHRGGQSKLKIAAEGISKELAVTAQDKGKMIQVQITQMATAKPANLTTKPDPGPMTQNPPKFRTQKEKLGYALGMNLANALQKQSVEVDEDSLLRGFKDAHAGSQARMTPQEVRATIVEMQNELKALASKENQEIAEKNRKAGEAFLAENKKKEGVVTLPSGLQYRILQAGEGKKPTATDAVNCNYRATLIDGTEFDSSYRRKRSAAFAVNNVIKGWSEALQLMPVGSKWQLFVPSDLAYGERGTRRGGIGPDTTLIYEVELLSIRDMPSGADARATKAQAPTNAEAGDSPEHANYRAAPVSPVAVKQ